MKRYHYTYRITNTQTNKYYYGSRTTPKKKEVLPINDLGIKYFSSSKDKDFIKDQKQNPKNYKYKVIQIFDTRQEAIELEIKLHNRFNVGINESFYNRAKQTSTGFDTTGTIAWNKGHKGCIDYSSKTWQRYFKTKRYGYSINYINQNYKIKIIKFYTKSPEFRSHLSFLNKSKKLYKTLPIKYKTDNPASRHIGFYDFYTNELKYETNGDLEEFLEKYKTTRKVIFDSIKQENLYSNLNNIKITLYICL